MIRFVLTIVAFLAAVPALAEIKIKEVTSPGGITAWLVEEHSIPFVALELQWRGGTTLDPEGKTGVTNLMMGLLEEGSGELDSRAFAREVEELAASFSYRGYRDAVTVSARFLTENRDASVSLLRKSIIEPSFPDEAIERVRGQVLSIIRSDLSDPSEIASQSFNRLAFGDHPYANPTNGYEDTVAALTRDDIVAAHQAVMAKDNLFVGVVGDITEAELGAMLDDLLGDLPETSAPPPTRAEVAFEGGTTVVEFDTPQSVAIFGHEGLKRDDPDFFAAYLLNQILGGSGFDSRLMTEVREKRGLTYGVYSFLVPMDHAELYMGQVSSANDRVAEAIEVIRVEWARMAENGLTDEELAKAKSYLTGAYPLRFDGNGAIASILVGMQAEGLPLDYVATRNDKVNAVTLDDVNRVARELLRPEKLHFVVVGKPEGV
ncbi:M16 family metallopeptidase [Shimia biformata]|uniref:M16 family metallopeptidase n=1 Tax=Shimia biformata TaxID=1294299 RepID=UPI00194EE524|nr:pitrilysin family protein [Shimia biformata]